MAAERTVTEIRVARPGSKRRDVYLDGELWRSMPLDVVRALSLEVGDVVPSEVLDRQRADTEPGLAQERALRLLAYKDRSLEQIAERLLEDGFSAAVAREVAEDLVERGLVDDERFARTLAAGHLRRGIGRGRILRELEQKGVPAGVAQAVVDSLAPVDDEADRARAEAARIRRRGDSAEKLAARLARKGFGVGVAMRAARAADTASEQHDVDMGPDPL